MEQVKFLNETPVRTSKSFGINNIKIKELEIPEVKEFTNVKINGFSIKTEKQAKCKIIKDTLKYELEESLTNQIINKANQKIYIEIPENKIIHETIEIEFNITEKQNILVDNIYVQAGKNSRAEIIIKYKSEKEEIKGYHNGICSVFARENADVKITILNLLNENTSNFHIMNNKLESKANLEYIVTDFGGQRSITNYYSNIEGEEANAELNTIYLGKNSQLIDMNYIAEVYGAKSNIDIEVYGALTGDAQKNFKGTIDFKTGCKKAKGNESEYCMLLSKTAKSKALPMLLCREDDVVGNHSNSAGKIDEEKLYYIMSRGISYEEARKLIVKAKFNSIIEKLNNEKIKQEIIKEIDRRIV